MEASGQLRAPTTLSSGRGSQSYYTGGWVGPRASLDIVDKRKSLALPGIKLWFLFKRNSPPVTMTWVMKGQFLQV